ncbi:Kazal-like serine protease inhibitor domain-containing protein [Phytophthora cinnamomi]|uniref:Kazal-like serine protease inhibitor domain-containing protein n=1 Tax=Phytophthora cinnamomi TaxID=4785 RepID=UPI0035599650|nr:Kazal-like serine protease inhibitor domain-containing protein [Phytophthora cinnamomi]
MKLAAVAVISSLVLVGISADGSTIGIPADGSTIGIPACGRNVCSDKVPLVCGSNGVTYENKCDFDFYNCGSGGKWRVLHEGMCTRTEGEK